MLEWISRCLSEGDGQPSAKRVLFSIAVLTILAFCAGHTTRNGMDMMVVDLLKSVLYATAAAYGVARFAEKVEPAP